MKKSDASKGQAASKLISERIAGLRDWRGRTLARVRKLVKEADPDVVEEWKWDNPIWSHDGIVCTGETYKKAVKLTFAKGAALSDPARLFNSSLEGNTRRAIDIHEGEEVDAPAFKALFRAAAALNRGGKPASKSSKPKPGMAAAKGRRSSAARTAGSGPSEDVVLLSGGNPQISKADGDAPVQKYIAAMPGWKRDVGRRLDALVARAVPDVRKAVKWNSPFYGVEGQGWFMTLHCFSKYVKVAFTRGTSLKPLPPGESKQDEVRYLDIHEGNELDEKLLTSWVRQASKMPGWFT